MNEKQIKQYYERIEKLLNGANKETYGFAPEDIRQILKWYEVLQQENQQLNQLLKDKGFIIDKLMEENRQLKENRNKAIKYIKTTNFWGLYDDTPMEEVKYGEDLLQILKGENK